MTDATIRDVARRAQVSVASVSRALNNLANVSEQTRARVADAVRELGYVPHAGARRGHPLPCSFGEAGQRLCIARQALGPEDECGDESDQQQLLDREAEDHDFRLPPRLSGPCREAA